MSAKLDELVSATRGKYMVSIERKWLADIKVEVDTKISDLLAKYDALEKSWIEGTGAYEELTAERDRYKAALASIAGELGTIPWNRSAIEAIARNALREGV